MNAAASSLSKSLVVRFGLVGAGLGLLAGGYEAALLYFRPRIPALLNSDVGYCVWFLAPLVNELLFGLIAIASGFAAAFWQDRAPQRPTLLASIGFGAAAGFVVNEAFWTHTPLSKARRLFLIVLVVTAVSVITRSAFKRWRNGRLRSLELQTPSSWRRLAKGVVTATLLLISGLAFYLIWPGVPLPRVQFSRLAQENRPNIVLISLDTVRADHLHCYGYARPTTPNLDRAARQGVLFESAIAPSSWTLPSHATMLTGLSPHQHGADFDVPLATGILTAAQVLKARGYETAGFTSNYDYGYSGWGIAQGFEVYNDDSHSLRHNLLMVSVARHFRQLLFPPVISYDQFGRRDAAELNHEIFRWFRGRSKHPFFLFINYFDAHDPYLAPAPYEKYFGGVSYGLLRRLSPVMNWKPPVPPLSGEERELLIADYDNCLAYLDDQVGKLLRFLASLSEWPNTIVIITADHGEAFGEHGGYYGHGWGLCWQLLHVPLIVLGPGVPASQRIANIVGTSDLFSTLLAVAGNEAAPVGRHTLSRFWTSVHEAKSFDEAVLSELGAGPAAADRHPAAVSLVTQEWHYVQNAFGSCQLYHWSTDADEAKDLCGLPQYKRFSLALRQQVERSLATSPRPWLGVGYLAALGRPSDHVLDGIPQSNPRPTKEQEDLLRNLPYQ
jgi:arylsulfatase A-like enzyme